MSSGGAVSTTITSEKPKLAPLRDGRVTTLNVKIGGNNAAAQFAKIDGLRKL